MRIHSCDAGSLESYSPPVTGLGPYARECTFMRTHEDVGGLDHRLRVSEQDGREVLHCPVVPESGPLHHLATVVDRGGQVGVEVLDGHRKDEAQQGRGGIGSHPPGDRLRREKSLVLSHVRTDHG